MPVVTDRIVLRNQVIAGNDGDFAEEIRIEHWREARTDPDRPTDVIWARLETPKREDQSLSGDRSSTFAAEIRTGGACLKIDRQTYPALDIQEGDIVIAATRAGSPKWKVASVDDRNFERLVVNLGDAG